MHVAVFTKKTIGHESFKFNFSPKLRLISPKKKKKERNHNYIITKFPILAMIGNIAPSKFRRRGGAHRISGTHRDKTPPIPQNWG